MSPAPPPEVPLPQMPQVPANCGPGGLTSGGSLAVSVTSAESMSSCQAWGPGLWWGLGRCEVNVLFCMRCRPLQLSAKARGGHDGRQKCRRAVEGSCDARLGTLRGQEGRQPEPLLAFSSAATRLALGFGAPA